MNQSVTYATELLIGLGCLVASAGALRRSRVLAAILAVAGLAAVIHAAAALLSLT